MTGVTGNICRLAQPTPLACHKTSLRKGKEERRVLILIFFIYRELPQVSPRAPLLSSQQCAPEEVAHGADVAALRGS